MAAEKDLKEDENCCNKKIADKDKEGKLAVEGNEAGSFEAGGVEELMELFLKMSTTGFNEFEMGCGCPFILYDYVKNERNVVIVDFLIPSVHRRFLRLKISEAGLHLDLLIIVPPVFYNPDRLLYANAYKRGFNVNSYKAMAFQGAAQKVLAVCSNDQLSDTEQASEGETRRVIPGR